MSRFRSRYRAGDWVEVRSAEEILATLDSTGSLDRLPFMPEMLAACGGRFQVAASAHKTCDTIHKTGGRRMRDAVHLADLRCDGSRHGGCQARCLVFWKEAWLKPAVAPADAASGEARVAAPAPVAAERTLLASARVAGKSADDVVYVCQATRLYDATSPLARWSPRQYLADVRSGNVGAGEALEVLFLALVHSLRELRYGYRLALWLYERAHLAVRKCPSPYGTGLVPQGTKTPSTDIAIDVGAIVTVKPHDEILATLDARNRNRGLSFDKEMVRYCGQQFRVGARVTRIVDESTGRMLHMPRPSLILEGTYCTSRYSERRLLCPRRIVPYWREIWLQPVQTGANPVPPAA
jgi:hypothetical protein